MNLYKLIFSPASCYPPVSRIRDIQARHVARAFPTIMYVTFRCAPF